MSFGDVDRDCDGTLLLSEQGDPLSIRRSFEVGGPESEDRFEPSDFVPGRLVDFDEVSEQGGTITEGSLIYTPPDGFLGTDRFTFLMEGRDDIVREVEVLVEVTEFVEGEDDASDDTGLEPTEAITEDAVDRVLGAQDVVVEMGERWDPPWLAWMVTLALGLVALAVAWWLLLVVRIQDRMSARR